MAKNDKGLEIKLPGEPEPEATVPFMGIVREGMGWSLYRLQIPVSWLAEGERMREGDSLMSVLAHQRQACVRESQR